MALLGFWNNPWELIIIALLALLFFGNGLPKVMRSLGEGVTEFKKGLEGKPEEDDDELDRPRNKKAVSKDDTPAVKHEPEAAAQPETEPVKDPAAKTS